MALTAASTMLFLTNFTSFGQENGSIAKLDNTKSGSSAFSPANSVSTKNSKSTKMAAKALRSFSIDFKDVKNANWFVTDFGEFLASFENGSVKTTVYYDNRGRYAGSIKRYGEKDMPESIRHMVKSTYYDYTIDGIEEVETAGSTIYVVHIQDSTSAKTLHISDEGMEVVLDLTKP